MIGRDAQAVASFEDPQFGFARKDLRKRADVLWILMLNEYKRYSGPFRQGM